MAMLKAKKKRKKLNKRTILRKALDKLWREIIYLQHNYTCEKCNKICKAGKNIGSGNSINAHHIIERTKFNTRWDLDNGVALCNWCHTFSPEAPKRDKTGFLNWLKEHRREGLYEELLKKAGEEGGAKKRTLLELIQLKEELKQQLQTLLQTTNV